MTNVSQVGTTNTTNSVAFKSASKKVLTKEIPTKVKEAFVKRNQAYYDTFAKEIEKGAIYTNEKNGHVINTYGFGGNNYVVELYKLKPGMTPEQIVKNEKCLYELSQDSYHGLHEFDRYLKHGTQDNKFLSTSNAQRRFWNETGRWEVKDGNPYVRYQTYYKDNSHSAFGKCIDQA